MDAWLRKLKVTLYADLGDRNHVELSFGDDPLKDQLAISISGTKFMSPMKDEFTIHIKNIPENSDRSVIQLKDIDFRYVSIDAGYAGMSERLFFGYIVSMTTKRIDNTKTLDTILVCSGSYTYNNLHGKTLTLKKGLSYYDALMFAARLSGIMPGELELPNTLKRKRFQQDFTFDGTLTSMLIQLQQLDKSLLCHCDFTSHSKFKIWDANVFTPRLVKLNPDNIVLTNGFPSIEDQGIVFTVLPFFNFIPGDEIIFDDAKFINVAIESLSSYTSIPDPSKFIASGNESNFVYDENQNKSYEEQLKSYVANFQGRYIIRELRYNLENRGNDFTIGIKCYSKELYQKIKGTLS